MELEAGTTKFTTLGRYALGLFAGGLNALQNFFFKSLWGKSITFSLYVSCSKKLILCVSRFGVSTEGLEKLCPLIHGKLLSSLSLQGRYCTEISYCPLLLPQPTPWCSYYLEGSAKFFCVFFFIKSDNMLGWYFQRTLLPFSYKSTLILLSLRVWGPRAFSWLFEPTSQSSLFFQGDILMEKPVRLSLKKTFNTFCFEGVSWLGTPSKILFANWCW